MIRDLVPTVPSQGASSGTRERNSEQPISRTVTPLDLSIVVPAYNEVDSVEALYEELLEVMSSLEQTWECIFVDDGSTDGTTEVMERLCRADSRVRLIRFVRNAGKSAAYDAGFTATCGKIVVTLDADLQDDPREIPAMLARLEEADLVVGWKQDRMANEPLKTVPSRVFNRLLGWSFGLTLHDSNCGFRVMRRAVATTLELYGDLYRFIPELAHVRGFRVAEQPVQHRKRKFGQSKYGARRFWTGLLDLLTVRFITKYAQRPLHFLGTLGLIPFLIGLGLETYVLTMKLAFQHSFSSHIAATIVGVMFILVGFQCVITGLIGEMMSAQWRQRHYLIDPRSEPPSRRDGDR